MGKGPVVFDMLSYVQKYSQGSLENQGDTCICTCGCMREREIYCRLPYTRSDVCRLGTRKASSVRVQRLGNPESRWWTSRPKSGELRTGMPVSKSRRRWMAQLRQREQMHPPPLPFYSVQALNRLSGPPPPHLPTGRVDFLCLVSGFKC